MSAAPIIETVVFRDDTDPALAWLGPGKCTVIASLSDGSTIELVSFYSDEHRFSEGSFAGLTVEAALSRFHSHDVAFLQSR